QELQQRVVEGLALVDGVVLLGQRAARLDQLQAGQAQPLLLEALEDGPGQAALQAVGLQQDEGGLHGKPRGLWSGPAPAGAAGTILRPPAGCGRPASAAVQQPNQVMRTR